MGLTNEFVDVSLKRLVRNKMKTLELYVDVTYTNFFAQSQ